MIVQRIRHATMSTGRMIALHEFPDFTPRNRLGDGLEYARREFDLEQIRKELSSKEDPDE